MEVSLHSIVYSLITYKLIYYTVFVHYLKRFLSTSHAVLLCFYYIFFIVNYQSVLSSSVTSFPRFTTTIIVLVSLLFYASQLRSLFQYHFFSTLHNYDHCSSITSFLRFTSIRSFFQYHCFSMQHKSLFCAAAHFASNLYMSIKLKLFVFCII